MDQDENTVNVHEGGIMTSFGKYQSIYLINALKFTC